MRLEKYNIRKAPVYLTNPRPQIKELDNLPIIDRSLIDYDKYHQFIGHAGVKYQMALQPTRGCTYKCFYCDVYKTYKNHYRRSISHLFNEVRLLADIGVKRLEFIDDIFNVNIKDFVAFFELVLKHRLDIKLCFSTGLRGDLLNKDIIDLMAEAGTIMIQLSLEHPSPRLQKIMRKNLNIEKLHENLQYFAEKYPSVVLQLNAMHGFPTETEEEALMTLDFIKSIKWLHFPYLFNVVIFPGTELEQFALEHGISKEAIEEAQDMSYYEEASPALPFSADFTKRVRMMFFKDYVLNKERLLHVLPYQMENFSEDELNQKYNRYFPTRIKSLNDVLNFVKIDRREIGSRTCLDESQIKISDLKNRIRERFPSLKKRNDALRLLLIDLTTYFSDNTDTREYKVVESPFGLMALLSYINREFEDTVEGMICKSHIDFDSYEELYNLINDFNPDIIGIRTMTYYKVFFHETIDYIRKRGISAPIIAGGPYPTASYADILQDKNINIAVIGEGEITLAEIIKHILANDKRLPDDEVLKNISGIAFVEKEGG
jgi:radical SAM superfamily enzyme YgiQ (UPF0313 family)